MNREEAPDERFAKGAVERATNAQLFRHDNAGRQGAVDYLMRYPDGRSDALEITSVSNDKARAT